MTKKIDKSVHFLTKIPNTKEGWSFIKQIKKHLNKGRYRLRIKGRGTRKYHGNQSYVPLPHAEHYSIYIDQKIVDNNNPQYFYEKGWKSRVIINNMKEEVDKLERLN